MLISPDDFSFRYWNNAPDDQQIDFPDPDIRISLFNLTRDGELHVQLPGTAAYPVENAQW
ncbi:DUF2169 domain-containing protein [Xenorhabdus japonica]|uniref:DUF2169 domain-containing protein n=1 Tax=Xenorhabdus japonica TaxID=53341 RepID=UPI000B8484C9